MVAPLSALSGLNVAARLAAFTGRSVGPSLTPLSQRAIARLTGIPRSTLGDFLRDPERVRPATVERMNKLLTDPRLNIARPGLRTVRIDAPAFTRQSLGALERPDGARGFAYVYETTAYGSGVGQTILSPVSDEDPADALGLVPGGEDAIVSVLWYVG